MPHGPATAIGSVEAAEHAPDVAVIGGMNVHLRAHPIVLSFSVAPSPADDLLLCISWGGHPEFLKKRDILISDCQ
jgi:hypothetical protein